MTPVRTTFQRQLAFGAIGESKVANWLRSRGNAILPVYDVEYETGKGPRLFAPDKQLVAPDMLSIRSNGICWIEAKHKTVFSWYRNGKRWETGIDLHHYRNYLEIANRYPYEIWLMFLHLSSTPDPRDVKHGCPRKCPTGLFAGRISDLRKNETHRDPRWGRHGMVYWAPQQEYWADDSLRLYATLEDVEAAQPNRSTCPDHPSQP